MKKLVYLVVCCATVASFAACKGKNKTAQTPAVAAKEYVELIKVGNYEEFVDAIVFEEPAKAPAVTPEQKKAVKTSNAQALKTVHHATVEEKGGLKDVAVVSETVAPDGQTADVILAGTYNNGEIETITCKMVNDEKRWKIRVNDNKEVWKAVNKDGDREVIKIREGHDRDFVKIKEDGERDIFKDIEYADRKVEKIKIDGDREIHIDRTTPHGEVIKVVENGKVVKAVKTKNTEHKAEIKTKADGEKDFVKVIEKRDGQVEVIKTLHNGERHREVIKDLVEGDRHIEKIKEDGDKAVLKVKDEANKEVIKAKENIDGETVRVKEVVEK